MQGRRCRGRDGWPGREYRFFENRRIEPGRAGSNGNGLFDSVFYLELGAARIGVDLVELAALGLHACTGIGCFAVTVMTVVRRHFVMRGWRTMRAIAIGDRRGSAGPECDVEQQQQQQARASRAPA